MGRTASASHLQHGDEITQEASEDPVLNEEDSERERQQEDAHDHVAHSNVHDERAGRVPVQPPPEDVGDHGHVPDGAEHHQEAVQHEEQRIDVGQGLPQLRLGEVDRLVGEGLEVVDDLSEELVGDLVQVGVHPHLGGLLGGRGGVGPQISTEELMIEWPSNYQRFICISGLFMNQCIFNVRITI